MKKKTLGELVRERRLELGLSQERLAELAGVSQGLIGQIENFRNSGSKYLVAIAQALQVSPEWLAAGGQTREKPKPINVDEQSDYAPIWRVRFKLSAGVSGYEIEYLNSHRAPIFFRQDWLKERGLLAEHLLAVEVMGRSMEPSLFEGDLVVVNTADAKPTDGEVYAANFEGELVVKRLVRNRGEWFLASDNTDKRRYPDKRCDERTSLIGRIVYKQSERI